MRRRFRETDLSQARSNFLMKGGVILVSQRHDFHIKSPSQLLIQIIDAVLAAAARRINGERCSDSNSFSSIYFRRPYNRLFFLSEKTRNRSLPGDVLHVLSSYPTHLSCFFTML